MAKRLVELHGGTISAHSGGPGRGATFTVAMPAIEAPAAQSLPSVGSTAANDKRRVLVIEDNEDARESLALLLRHAGHEVHTAAGGRSGIELARRLTPDFALVDIGLPDIDGYEVARQVRACPRLASMHLIAITGYGNQNDRRTALASGFEQHFTKPVDFEAIDSLLRSA
jgi:CheY-like chemotaxis protein